MEIELCKKFIYRVGQNDNINLICNKFNTSVENILRNNCNIPLYEGELVEITLNDYVSYHVKPTESLKNIALKFNTTIDKLKKDNQLEDEKLYIGQLIKIYK